MAALRCEMQEVQEQKLLKQTQVIGEQNARLADNSCANYSVLWMPAQPGYAHYLLDFFI